MPNMRLLRLWMQTSDPDRPYTWANWPPAALGRASREESSPLAICRRHGREHAQLTGWEAVCGGCDHAGWRSAAGVFTGGLAPRGWCPTICALLPPSGSSSHERSPLTRWVSFLFFSAREKINQSVTSCPNRTHNKWRSSLMTSWIDSCGHQLQRARDRGVTQRRPWWLCNRTLHSTDEPNRRVRGLSSGYLLSFRFRAAVIAAPLTLAHRGLAFPSRVRGQTNVVSTAICAPLKRGRPSTTTSNLRVSRGLNTPMSMSRTRTLVRTRPPPSRQMRAAAFSNGNPLVPRTPATGQADRWWPNLSRRPPHRQE